jgi:hypothetical protein
LLVKSILNKSITRRNSNKYSFYPFKDTEL